MIDDLLKSFALVTDKHMMNPIPTPSNASLRQPQCVAAAGSTMRPTP
jgi:hypothetical protein